MKKISLTVIGLYICFLSAFSQSSTKQDTAYKSRKLKIDEINFVSGYYHQDGNNSAVTGGIGSERLTDFANTLELKVSKYDNKWRKHDLSFELGIDTYTSASSDKIDPHTLSSASMSDTRIYPSMSWNLTNEKKGTTFGATASYSQEFDYQSFGAALNFSKTTENKNSEFAAKLQAYLDKWKVIYPIELRPQGYGTGGEDGGSVGSQPRNSFSVLVSYSQVINTRLQATLIIEPTYQQGLLATKYQRVYFTDGSEQAETLPDKRFKIPLGIRANYFLGDRFIIRSYYRFYTDDWGLRAHTIDLEVPVKITPFFSLSPFYRFYTQKGIKYFAPYGMHQSNNTYFTSDYDLSKFTSNYFGMGIRIAPPKGVLGIQQLNSLELRFGHYIRSTDLNSNIVSLHLKFKP